jgi:hypothetical protein
MHPAAAAGFATMLTYALHDTRESGLTQKIVDLGGADVNGTIHSTIRSAIPHATIDVVDITPGPGVTVIADARSWRPAPGFRYDLVVSTECLEHVSQWRRVIDTAAAALRVGGWFVGTAASVGRAPHGARGAHLPAPDEHYDNVDPTALLAALWDAGFWHLEVRYQRNPSYATTHDVYWAAQRG